MRQKNICSWLAADDCHHAAPPMAPASQALRHAGIHSEIRPESRGLKMPLDELTLLSLDRNEGRKFWPETRVVGGSVEGVAVEPEPGTSMDGELQANDAVPVAVAEFLGREVNEGTPRQVLVNRYTVGEEKTY